LLVVASANGAIGMDAAWRVLAGGGSALDAVEAGTREVESNPDDHSVGYGGYPNIEGVVELDASIMDGTSRAAGAVAGLRRTRYALTVARAVMEQSPHVLVVGEGADRLAEVIGLPAEDLLTDEAKRTWQQGLEGALPSWVETAMLERVRALTTDPERAAGTVNFLAIDGGGHIASAVSTSGWAWKLPGRAGDSPGAAACTGHGELALRAATAHSIVRSLAEGAGLADACTAAMDDLAGLTTGPLIMHTVAVDAAGNHCGATTRAGATYVFRADGMASHEEAARVVVDVSGA
jgi:beta-aspartyl-peptidase (threonine type)